MDNVSIASDPLPQLFQQHLSPNSPPVGSAIGILTRFYPRLSQHVILWSDIALVFTNAQYVSHKGLLVPFLTDGDLNALPQKMILYHPGVILKVIVAMHAEHTQEEPTTQSSSNPGLYHSIDTAHGNALPVTNIAVGTESWSSDVTHIDIDPSLPQDCDKDKGSSTPVTASENQSSSQELTVHIRQDLRCSSMATSSKWKYVRPVREKPELQRVEENQRAQENETQLVEVIHDLVREVQAMRQQCQDLSRHALDRFAADENRVQTLITQTYELHEYPVPRLFIILPKEGRKRDISRNLVSKTFRLHFLCECGAHTGYETDGSPHKIHLANHDGYDIIKQSEFINKYGPYLLMMLRMVKFSLIAAEAAVPALQHFKAVQGLDRIASLLRITSRTFSALLDESISFVKDQSVNNEDIVVASTHPVDLNNLLGLKGPQLRQLESFLKLNDRSHVLGNLYRIATKSGHIKWVCKDHYQGLSSPSAIKELGAFTKAVKGTFIEEEGMVRVGLDSETRAEEFYGMMVRARCIHELRVALDWTVTRDHLQDLYEAVTDSNIVRLEVSGCGQAEDTLTINDSLFQPLLDLMANGKIHTMVLERVYHRDFLYVNESKMGITSRLRELTFRDLSTLEDGRIPTLSRIIKFCPSLIKLSVKSEFAHDILSWIQRDPSCFPRLKTLVAHETGYRHYHLVVGLSRGKIKSIEVIRLSSGSWGFDGLHKLLSCGHITKLGILLDGADAHGARCMEILRCNPKVYEFHFFIPELCASAVDWVISSMRESHAKQQSIPQYQIKIHCDAHPEVVSCTLDFYKSSQIFSISTHIQLTPQGCNMHNLIEFVREYGWSVTRLDFRIRFSSELALALDSSLTKSGSSLKRLLLDPARLTSSEDFACIDRIIGQSKLLTTFSAVLRMDDNNWIAGASWLFGAYREVLTGLIVEGAKGFIWNKKLANLFPSRRELKSLEVLSLKRVDTAKNVELFVKWVANMISNPLPLQTSRSRHLHCKPTSNTPEQVYLKNIELDSINLKENHWKAIFEAIDCTALERLRLFNNRLTSEQLDDLIQCIINSAGGSNMLPLEELNIANNLDSEPWHVSEEALAKLKKKAPQLFESAETSGILLPHIKVPARIEDNSNYHFVLWSDVQKYFPNAKYALNGANAVPFMIDDDFQESRKDVPQGGLSVTTYSHETTFFQALTGPIVDNPGDSLTSMSVDNMLQEMDSWDSASRQMLLSSSRARLGFASDSPRVLPDLGYHLPEPGLHLSQSVLHPRLTPYSTIDLWAPILADSITPSLAGSITPSLADLCAPSLADSITPLMADSTASILPPDLNLSPSESLDYFIVHDILHSESSQNRRVSDAAHKLKRHKHKPKPKINESLADSNVSEVLTNELDAVSERPLETSQYKALALLKGVKSETEFLTQEIDHDSRPLTNEEEAQKRMELLQKTRLYLQQELQVMQKECLDIKRSALLSVADMRRRIAIILGRTDDLQRDSEPRLFIVLPMRNGMSDTADTNPLTKFRLYFLCECSTDTNSEDDDFSQGIHFVKHEGYDIRNPNDFFQKYGPYLLTMLQMVKYGFVAARIRVPVLAHFKQINGIDSIKQTLNITQATIGSLVDDSIAYIKNVVTNIEDVINMPVDSLNIDNQDVLDGVDLRQVRSHLKVNNESSRVLSNLHRIVDSEGHIKWVCVDHYHNIYETSAIEELKTMMVTSHTGQFFEEKGLVDVQLPSSIQAEQFYDVMVKTRCVVDLKVSLQWDPTRDDLQILAKAVTKANIACLRIKKCVGVEGVLNIDHSEAPNKSLFQPILQLMSNGKLQAIDFDWLQNRSFPHVDVSIMKSAPRIRELSVNWITRSIKGYKTTFTAILARCPSLVTLSIKTDFAHDALIFMLGNMSRFSNLKTLKITDTGSFGYSFDFGISDERVQSLNASSFKTRHWELEGMKELLLGGYLTEINLTLDREASEVERHKAIVLHNTKLTEAGLKKDTDIDILRAIVRHNSKLMKAGIRIDGRHVKAIALAIAATGDDHPESEDFEIVRRLGQQIQKWCDAKAKPLASQHPEQMKEPLTFIHYKGK
ncbi:hypothetical protein BGZ99_002634 [Dissophora globulifera]|uniref:Uncharacterized protein n=1 Tax=Dissophora globulifera TaxID=979702 RepID=A0A9P6RNE2_9FUNG|nr:hypothetical protein BGZ99_002634 [Dissophora globulifera]